MSANSTPDARKSSFPPVVAPDCRLLILGSLPGEASLAARRYYAHPRNLFWTLLGPAIGVDLASLGYEERLAALIQAKVGVWDTVDSAIRAGSLDAAIREESHNPLERLAGELSGLRAVAFNGRKAARIGRRLLASADIALVDLPSSSPANASIPLDLKAETWHGLRNFLA